MQESMPNVLLAFLSTCGMEMGNENLPNEVIHLGSTLSFAGFWGVIVTMCELPKFMSGVVIWLFEGPFWMPMAPRSQILSTKTFLKSAVLLQQMLLDPIPLKLPKHSLCHQFVCRKSIFCLLGSFYLYGEVRPHSLAKQQETYLYQFTVIYTLPSHWCCP